MWPDIARAFAEAYRVLRPGGRIAFTNWIVHRRYRRRSANCCGRHSGRDTEPASKSMPNCCAARALNRKPSRTRRSMGDYPGRAAAACREIARRSRTGRHAFRPRRFYRSYVLFVDLVSAGKWAGAVSPR